MKEPDRALTLDLIRTPDGEREAPSVNWEERNKHGVRLRRQTGDEAIIGFSSLIAAMSPAERAAFEVELAAHQKEFAAIIEECGYYS